MAELTTWNVYEAEGLSIRNHDCQPISCNGSRFGLKTPSGRVAVTPHPEKELNLSGTSGHIVFEGSYPGIKVFSCNISGGKGQDLTHCFSFYP